MPVDFNAVKQIDAKIKVVLMKTSHSGNIGAVARAIKNMGLSQLCLVDPADFPSDEATRRSSGATDLLANAECVDNLDEALANCHFVVGASARTRNIPWPLMNPRACADKILTSLEAHKDDANFRVAILFGREASGLTNEELQRCHYHVNIPANPEYSSLNLAMAVQVIAYELRMSALLTEPAENESIAAIIGPKAEGWDVDAASVDEVEGFLQHLEDTLIKTGFHDPKTPRMLMTRLRRLFQRAEMDKMEVNIMRGVLKSVQNLLRQG